MLLVPASSTLQNNFQYKAILGQGLRQMVYLKGPLELTANMCISVYNAGCPERMLEGETKTAWRRSRTRCKQTEIKQCLFSAW